MKTTILLLAVAAAWGQTADKLESHNAKTEEVTYRGKKAVHVSPVQGDKDGVAIVQGTEIGDATIEVDLAGAPGPGAFEGARGFIGMAFRVAAPEKFELLYLRPTNGRAEDQLRRNHSTQYVSSPDWPWQKLRSESPGVYESYVDLEPAVWTRMKIVVAGTTARLYVNGAEQPCLIVNDLKRGTAKGAVALWVGPGTDGYFSGLRITSAK